MINCHARAAEAVRVVEKSEGAGSAGEIPHVGWFGGASKQGEAEETSRAGAAPGWAGNIRGGRRIGRRRTVTVAAVATAGAMVLLPTDTASFAIPTIPGATTAGALLFPGGTEVSSLSGARDSPGSAEAPGLPAGSRLAGVTGDAGNAEGTGTMASAQPAPGGAGTSVVARAVAAPGPADGAGMRGLSGQEVADRAKKELDGASSLQVEMRSPAQSLKIALDEGGDCAGTVKMRGKGTIDLVKQGSTVWIKPDAEFWKNDIGGERGAKAAEKFDGRYIKGSSDDAVMSQLSSACDLQGLKDGTDPSARGGGERGGAENGGAGSGAVSRDGEGQRHGAEKWKRGERTEHRGKPAIPLTRTERGVKVTMLVADEGKPYPLKISRKGGGQPGGGEEGRQGQGQSQQNELRLSEFDRPVSEKKPDDGQCIGMDELQRQLSKPPAERV